MLRRPFRFRRDQSGAAAIEFALVLPFMTVMLLGSIDFGYYLIMRNKIGNATTQIADVVSREYDNEIAVEDIDEIFDIITVVAPRLSRQFDVSMSVMMIDFDMAPGCTDPYETTGGCTPVPVVQWNYTEGFDAYDLCQVNTLTNTQRTEPGSMNIDFMSYVPTVMVFMNHEYESLTAGRAGLTAEIFTSRVLATRNGKTIAPTGSGFEVCP